MKSSNLDKDLGADVCGLELFELDGKVEICGKPPVVWGLVDLPGWEDSQIVACHEHRNELFENEAVTVTSDAPFRREGEGECTCNP